MTHSPAPAAVRLAGRARSGPRAAYGEFPARCRYRLAHRVSQPASGAPAARDRWDLPTRWPMSAAPATLGLADLRSWHASAVPAARDRWDLVTRWPRSAAPAPT